MNMLSQEFPIHMSRRFYLLAVQLLVKSMVVRPRPSLEFLLPFHKFSQPQDNISCPHARLSNIPVYNTPRLYLPLHHHSFKSHLHSNLLDF